MASSIAEIEHAIGFNGGVPGALMVLPPACCVFGMSPASAAEAAPSPQGGPGSIRVVSAAGSCAVVGDLLDPHAQVFLRGHSGSLSACALSPSSRLLATGERGYDSDVCVWDLSTGQVIHRFQEHDHGIMALGFSDDERLLVSVGGEQDGLIVVWDLSNGTQVTRLRHEPAPVLCMAWGGFVKDIKGRDTALYQFATGGAKGVALWALDPLTGISASERVTRPVPNALSRDYLCLAFTPHPGKEWLYGGTASGDIVVAHTRSKAVYYSVFCTGGGVTALVAMPAPPTLPSGSPTSMGTLDYGAGRGSSSSSSSEGQGVHVIAGGGDGTITVYHHAVSTIEQDLVLSAAVSAAAAHGSGASQRPSLPSRTFLAIRALRVDGAVWSLASLDPVGARGHVPVWAPGGGGAAAASPAHPGPLAFLAGTSAGRLYRCTESRHLSTVSASGAGGRGGGGVGGGLSGLTAGGRPRETAQLAGGLSAQLLRQAHAAAGEQLDSSSAKGGSGGGGGSSGSSGSGSAAGGAPAASTLATPGSAALPPQLRSSSSVGGVWALSFPPGDSDHVATVGGDCTVRVWSTSDYGCVGLTGVRGAGRATSVVHAGEFHLTGWQDGALRAYYSAPASGAGGAEEAEGGGGAPGTGGGSRSPPRTLQGSSSLVRDGWRGEGSSSSSSSSSGHGNGSGSVGGEDRGYLWSIPDAHSSSRVAGGAAGVASHHQHYQGVTALAFASNQRFIVSGGADGRVRVWDVRSRELVSDFCEHAGAVSALAIYRDDAHVLSASRDRSFMCWDLRRDKRVSSHSQRQGGINGLCLSRDQSLIVTVGQERRIQMWDLREPAPVQVISPAAGATGEALCVASAHGRDVIATGGSDGLVRFWDLRAGGKTVAECIGHSGPVTALAWSPDDRQVVSVGGADGSILFWNFYG